MQLVAFLLIGIGAAAKASAFVTSVAVTGGIIACGVFLLLIAVIGLIGAVKHHQVLLFFVSFKPIVKLLDRIYFMFQSFCYTVADVILDVCSLNACSKLKFHDHNW